MRLFFLVGSYLIWLKKRVRDERIIFSIGLALGAAIHPLAFSYSFAWAFPMTALVIDRFRVSQSSTFWDWTILILGLFLMLVYGSGIMTNLGYPLPVFGERGLGCLLLSVLLIKKERDPRGAKAEG